MRRRLPRAASPLLALSLAVHAGCGKRADPLAPYVKTPQPPSALEVAQIGDEVEIRITAPRVTTENRPLPVIELEWLQAPLGGDFGKAAASLLREEVAPGELRTKRFPRPPLETRYSVRALSGKARSALVAPLPFKPAPVPASPSGLQAANTSAGVELRWIPPPGAEPWPSATPLPSPSPSPSSSALPSGSPTASPASPSTPAPSPSVLPSPSPSPSPGASPSPIPSGVPENPEKAKAPAVPVFPSPAPPPAVPGAPPSSASPLTQTAASPTPAPTPTPAPPTGIRIFRTDSTLRLAREPLQASMWLDSTVKPGDKPCYSVRYATSFKPLVESAPTEPVCVEVKDLIPPEPPGRLFGDIGATFVELSWNPSTSSDLASYRLYRSIGNSPRALVLQTEGLILRVQDPDLTAGPRTYDVVAVDKGGNESLPGTLLKIVVP